MAKCIGSIEQWPFKLMENANPEFIVESVREGERLLNIRLNTLSNFLLEIANDFNCIKQSTMCSDFKIDCTLIQDAIQTKLEQLQSEALSVIKYICDSKLTSSTKHRYFILYSYGMVEKLQQFFQIIGRLSDLDQDLYNAEHRKLLVSEESITIHTLITIWLANLELIKRTCGFATKVFENQSGTSEDNFDLINQLEFSTFDAQLNKVLVMDFIVTSWIRFNRLAKYEELAEGLPLLCPCNFRSFQRILKEAIAKAASNQTMLADLLPLILDYESKPSMMTISSRRIGVVPQVPCYTDSHLKERCFFIVWFLCSCSRILKDHTVKPMLANCNDILVSSLDNALKMFLQQTSPTEQQQRPTTPSSSKLSPYQEETLRLLLVLVDTWCEKTKNSLAVLTKLFSCIESNWSLFGENYFNNNSFKTNGLTMFQLFTKLIKLTILSENPTAPEEKLLDEIWNRLLDRIEPKESTPISSNKSAK